MTILEENVPSRDKHRLLKPNSANLKRKGAHLEAPILKKIQTGNMLNGYQRGNGDSSHDSPVATLSNMGNTCFLNSVLYTLRSTPTFLHNLHHLVNDLSAVNLRLGQVKAKTSSLGRNVGAITGPSARSTSSKDLLSLGNSDLIPKSKKQIVTERLHELFVTMHNLEVKESSDPYQPVGLLQAIREANYIFEGNHQQDAHELLVYLLDNIRETCDLLTQQVQQNPDLLIESEVITPSNSKLWGARKSWKKSHKKKEKTAKESISEEIVNGSSVTDSEDACSVESNNDMKKKLCYNFVAEDFEGITLRRTTCLECESITERKEPFYDIPVPIFVKDSDFEGDSINSEFYRNACVTSEKLCEANKYLCEKCQRYNEASRDVLFEKLPNIMVLQLKRFTTSSTGIQKVNTYLPTPLEMACFCETCCKVEENEAPPHRYRLCCVIMHLGASLASGHYITYVKASDHLEDYAECSRYIPKGSLSASSSEKSLNFLKLWKPRTIGSLSENKSILSKSVVNGVRMCKSMDCCGVKISKHVVENVVNSYSRKQEFCNGSEDMWLECDDESVRPISRQEFQEELSYKPNSTSTPYLLFYSKITDVPLD